MSSFPPVGTLLPHRPPMLLVDEVLEHEELRVVCQTTIRSDMLFVRDGAAPPLLAVELFAQSAATLMALVTTRNLTARDAMGAGDARIGGGALLGSRKIQLFVDELRVGDVLRIECEEKMAIGMTAQIECSMHRGETLVARGSINVMAGVPEAS